LNEEGNMREIHQQGPYHYVFSRYVDPIATVQPGETVAIYTDDAFESQITKPDDKPSEILGAYLNPQTGPIHIEGAEPGDTLEVTARVTVTFDLIKQRPIAWPRIESPDELMTVGSARPMEDAARIAYTELIEWMIELGWDRLEAYEALTQIGDLYVGNMVDTYYSLIAKIRKEYAIIGG